MKEKLCAIDFYKARGIGHVLKWARTLHSPRHYIHHDAVITVLYKDVSVGFKRGLNHVYNPVLIIYMKLLNLSIDENLESVHVKFIVWGLSIKEDYHWRKVLVFIIQRDLLHVEKGPILRPFRKVESGLVREDEKRVSKSVAGLASHTAKYKPHHSKKKIHSHKYVDNRKKKALDTKGNKTDIFTGQSGVQKAASLGSGFSLSREASNLLTLYSRIYILKL